ncbi:leucine-rich repeat protein [Bacteroides nordii]|uniref:leucine-rich repeat protein n=1 Tax=Bacteroides nordii TaxID=291645 RepID=UPI00399AFAD8
MEKKLCYSFFFFVFFIGLYSCGNDAETSIDPQITTIGNEDFFLEGVNFTNTSGEKSLLFTSNIDWSITVASTSNGEEWCSVTPNRGKAGKNTIKVKVNENVGVDDRNVSLTLRAGGLTKTITVVQKQRDALTLTTNKFEIGKAGGTINVEVKSNIDYEVIIPETCKNWIKQLTTTRGLIAKRLSFDIATSEEYEKREGEITIRSGKLTETAHVYQAGEGVLLLTKNEFPITDKGATITVEVKSNFDFDVKMPNVDWVKTATKTRGISSHTLYYIITPNETYEKRETEIVFYDKNSSIKDTVKIHQQQKNAIILGKKDLLLECDKGSFSIHTQSNIDYNISINCNWIKEKESAKTKSLNDKVHEFEFDKNDTGKKRIGKIIFTASGGITETLVVNQKAFYSYEIHIPKAGTLYSLIDQEKICQVDSLIVSGELNGTDVIILHRMEKLKHLDMKNVNIVSGGDLYYIYNSCKTENNKIGNWMFYGMGFETIILPNSITAIEENAFRQCMRLSKVTIPESVTYLGGAIFFECISLKSVTLPKNITYIPGYTFQECDLHSIEIPESVTEIGGYAFFQCFSLEKITIPSKVSYIGDQALAYLNNLKEIHVKAMPKDLRFGRLVFSGSTDASLYIPKGTKDAYYLTPLGDFKTVIEE